MESLEDRNTVAFSAHIDRAGKARRTCTNNCYLFTSLLRNMRYFHSAMAALIIRGKTLKPAYLNRFFNTMESFAHSAWRLALSFLGANAPTDRRKQIGSLYYSSCTEKVSFFDLADKPWDVDPHRAACNARSILALQTALCF